MSAQQRKEQELRYAAYEGKLKDVKRLARRVDVNTHDAEGWTPLWLLRLRTTLPSHRGW